MPFLQLSMRWNNNKFTLLKLTKLQITTVPGLVLKMNGCTV